MSVQVMPSMLQQASPSLTIVIPYYKRRFLEAALESLACQTNQGFEVFIGDDGSPENPADIIQKFKDRLCIKCRRFPDNLGRTSLVAQWNRCVRETSSEWVWLFSDDDVTSPECIANFYKTLDETDGKFDLYRFNTKIVDAELKIIHRPPVHPPVETVKEFAFAKFTGWRTSCAIEYIFRRNAFNAANGFVDFPLAWCSDDASWLAFSRRTGVRTIQNAEVFWRMSDLNLSAANPSLVKAKLKAFRKYLLWLRLEFPDQDTQQKFRSEVAKWFPDQLPHWGGKPDTLTGIRFWCFFSWFTHRADFGLLRKFINIPKLRGSCSLEFLFP